MNTDIITSDDGLKSLALAVARNKIGADDPIEEVLSVEGVDSDQFSRLLDDKVF